MKKQLVLLVTILFLTNTIIAQEQNFEKSFFPDRVDYTYRDISLASTNTGNYDLKHYRFNINIDPEISYISGSVTPSFLVTKSNTNSIYFDFNSVMSVDSVKYHGNVLPSSFSGTFELKIDLPNELVKDEMDSISIWYHGNPNTSGFGSFESSTQRCDESKPLLWTLSEPYGARDWWPTKQSLNDKIDSLDMYVTTPLGYKVGSNGLLQSVKEKDNKLTHHWKHNYPEPAYLIAIAVSDYTEYIDWVPLKNGDSLMVLEYVFPCNLNYAKSATPDIIPSIQFFTELFGDYPYDKEKYGHAQFGWGGGMEHASMTFVTSFGHLLLAHELAHQWFGDKITCGSWQDIWLNEGFATYLEGLTYDFGRDPSGWENWKTNNKNSALESKHGSVFVTDTTSVDNIFNGRLSYAKGAYLLHMLRWKLGDDDFFQALRNYIHDPELVYNYARTADLQKHLENQSGQNLDEFFKDWFYGKGNPTYSIEWWHADGDKTVIKINQSQSDNSVDFFEMPIPIRLQGEGQDTIVRLNNTYDGQIFTLTINFKAENLHFDPDQWLCANYNNPIYLKNSNLDINNSISIYPNPANDNVTIELPESSFIKFISLIDMSGKSVSKLPLNYQAKTINYKLPKEEISSGLYYIKVVGNQKVYGKKLVIK